MKSFEEVIMKAALIITMSALAPIANAEQGDAEDRLLTEQMMKNAVTQETQPTQSHPKAASDGVKTTTQSGHAVLNKKTDAKNGQ
jgi:hypothetical protein